MERIGHAPDLIRSEFERWVEWYLKGDVELDDVAPGCTLTGETLVQELRHCADIMPGSLCETFELPQGSTYAQGIRQMLKVW